MALPQGLYTFKVTWQTLQGSADTSNDIDSDPDMSPVTGTVTFTPRIVETTLNSGDGNSSLFIAAVTAQVGSDGILRNAQGDPWVSLFDPNSSGLANQGWTWQASFVMDGFKKASFDFTGTGGQTYDLAQLTPVATSPGVLVQRGPQGEVGPAGAGVPSGGLAGQILAKSTDTSYDTVWEDAPAGTGGGTVTSADITDASSAATPSVVALRDAQGNTAFNEVSLTDQVNPEHAVRKDYTDAGLTAAKNRANHTGTQPSSTISDLTEAVQDIVGNFIVAGTNCTVTYDDAGNTFTINATASGGGTTDPEVVRDTIGAALVAGTGIQIVVNDAGDTITISSTAVMPTRQVISGTGLSGGGDLSADRTLAVAYGTTAGTAVEGNDARLTADQAAATASIRTLGSGSQQAAPGDHTHAGMVTGTGISKVVQITQADYTALGAGTDAATLYVIVG